MMMSVQQRQYYYKQMLDLQEKFRKSEEEKIRLEEKYNKLVQESRIRHEACINRLRVRYIRFLEEQRVRDERNSKLLGALDKVDSNLAVIATKTERLNNLKKQYELYISRILEDDNAVCMLGDSATSEIGSKNDVHRNKQQKMRSEYMIKSTPFMTSSNSLYYRPEDRNGSMNIRFNPSSVQSSTSSFVSPRKSNYYSPLTIPSLSRSNFDGSNVRIPSIYSDHNNYLPQSFAKPTSSFCDRNKDLGIPSVDVPRAYTNLGYGNELNTSTNQSTNFVAYGPQRRNLEFAEGSPRDYGGSDLHTLIDKSAQMLYHADLPTYTSTPKKDTFSHQSSVDANLDCPTSSNKIVENLENKLDQYIQQIRNLHGKIEPATAAADEECESVPRRNSLNETSPNQSVQACNTADKTDLAITKIKSDLDENTNISPDEDKLDQPSKVDEDDAAGADEKYTTLTNVPVSDTSPETVAPVMDENNSQIGPLVTEIDEMRQIEDAAATNVDKTADQIYSLNIESNDEGVEEHQQLGRTNLDDAVNRDENGTLVEEVTEEHEENASDRLEDEVADDPKEVEQISYNYPDQYVEQEYGSVQNQGYSSNQDYDQTTDQQYYQEYQVGDGAQSSEQYEQNYDQYQYQQDPNETYNTDGQYPDSQPYADDNPSQQQYGYEYDNSNLNQQYETNQEQDASNYETNNEHMYSEQKEEAQYDYDNPEAMNEHNYEREDYVEQEQQGYAHANSTVAENEEREHENTLTKKRDNSDSESTIERNTVSNVESDFDFN